MQSFEVRAEALLKAKGIKITDQVTTKAIRIINRLARDTEESHLYPFVTYAERAIRWYQRVYFPANGPCSCLEYAMGLDNKMTEIVNGRA